MPTIQLTPNLSLVIPKHGDQKVFPSGMKTLPPTASASRSFFACAALSAVIDNETPAKTHHLSAHALGHHHRRFTHGH